MKSISQKRSKRGFSLVELLVVIAVLGIISAIAVVSLNGVNENSKVAAAKRQAQQIASVFGAGSATGAAGFKTATSVATAMNAVGVGSTGAGVMKNTSFQLPGITSSMDDDKPLDQQAKHYLSWSNGLLSYSPTGSSAHQYSSFDEWNDAYNAAMQQYHDAHPNNFDEAAFSAYMQAWMQANPQPDRHYSET